MIIKFGYMDILLGSNHTSNGVHLQSWSWKIRSHHYHAPLQQDTLVYYIVINVLLHKHTCLHAHKHPKSETCIVMFGPDWDLSRILSIDNLIKKYFIVSKWTMGFWQIVSLQYQSSTNLQKDILTHIIISYLTPNREVPRLIMICQS